MASQIEHSGQVSRIEHETVYVTITSQSACGSCKAREACGLSESQEKIVEVKTPDAANYAVGERVRVGIRKGAGGIAVFFAYVLALVVLMTLLIIGIKVMGWSEGTSALVALAGVGVYYVALWLGRHKLESKIHITINKD